MDFTGRERQARYMARLKQRAAEADNAKAEAATLRQELAAIKAQLRRLKTTGSNVASDELRGS